MSNADYEFVCKFFNFFPDIDCFASNNNKKTTKLYLKIPQLNTAGVNFFAQNLDLNFSYWACPPTHLIIDILKHISVVPVNMLLHISVWKSSNVWPFVVNRGVFHRHIFEVMYIRPYYIPNNDSDCIFYGKNNFFSINARISAHTGSD